MALAGRQMIESTAIDRDAVRDQLRRILESADFMGSPRICAFLRFVVEETLEGRGDRLKAFTIATVVYGRSADFNPQSNPLVRVEALRLRRMLERYYVNATSDDGIEIQINRGGYKPEFIARSIPVDEPEPTFVVEEEPSAAILTDRRPAIRLPFLVAGLAILAVVAGIGLALRSSGLKFPTGGAIPPRHLSTTIQVGPFAPRRDAGGGNVAQILTARIEDVLSRFENPVVIHGGDGMSSTDYWLTGEFGDTANGRTRLSMRIIHRASGEVIWGQEFPNISTDNMTETLASVSFIAGQIAQTYGIVHADLRKRLGGYAEGMEPIACVIYAYGVLNKPSAQGQEQALRCLGKAITANPQFVDAHTARAFLLVSAHLTGMPNEAGTDQIDLALESAHEAASLSPGNARPHAALFFRGRFEDAFESGKSAMTLNPYSGDIAARVGAARVLRGEFDAGAALLDRATHLSADTPPWQEFYFFLAAHMRGDNETAWRHAERHGAAATPLGLLGLVIAANEHGDAAKLKHWRERLAVKFPGFAHDIAASLDRYEMTPGIRDRLLADIDAAGGRAFAPRAQPQPLQQ